MTCKPSPRWWAVVVLLALLLLLYFSWQGLLRQGVKRWLAGQGWQLESFQGPEPGLKRFKLEALKLRRIVAGAEESQVAIELHDIVADWSWPDRRVSWLRAGSARLQWQQGSSAEPAPWPEVPALALPFEGLRIDALEVDAKSAGGRHWRFTSPVEVTQPSSGQYRIAFNYAGLPMLASLHAGETSSLELEWPGQTGMSGSGLYVTYAKTSILLDEKISKQATMKGDLDLANDLPLLQYLLQTPALIQARVSGRLRFAADLMLDQTIGQWKSATAKMDATAVRISTLDGKSLQADGSVRIELHPVEDKLQWSASFQPGYSMNLRGNQGSPWRADIQLKQAYSIESGKASSKPLPITFKPADGQALAVVVDRLRLQDLERPETFSASGRAKLPPVRFKPDWPELGLDADWHWQKNRLQAQGKLLGPQQSALLDWQGDYRLATGCADFRLDHKGQLPQVGRMLLPMFSNLKPLSLQAGLTSARFSGRYCPDHGGMARLAGELELSKGQLSWSKSLASGVHARLQLDDLKGPTGRLNASAETVALAAGLQLQTLTLQLDADKARLSLSELSSGLLGGSIASEPASLAWPPQSGAVTLLVEQVDLARLLAMLDFPGLEGSGRISGRLPLSWESGKAQVRDGELHSTEGGVLRYRPATPVADNIGLQALRDFRYSRLQAGVNYQADGQYRIALELDGHNPELYSGHPIDFKLNINGSLPGLLQGALLSGDFNTYLLKQLQQGKLQ